MSQITEIFLQNSSSININWKWQTRMIFISNSTKNNKSAAIKRTLWRIFFQGMRKKWLKKWQHNKICGKERIAIRTQIHRLNKILIVYYWIISMWDIIWAKVQYKAKNQIYLYRETTIETYRNVIFLLHWRETWKTTNIAFLETF